jgi:O-acetyl-ADP-ribose deacetylase
MNMEIVVGDITRQNDIDAVVNAANRMLETGGGVAGAIHRAAGPGLAREARAFAPIEPGQAVITGAYDLPNRFVVHCLGPVYGIDEPAAELLASCYENALSLAEEAGARSIAFPAISTGAFGYPMEEAAGIALEAMSRVFAGLQRLRLVRMVLFDEASAAIHREALGQIKP